MPRDRRLTHREGLGEFTHRYLSRRQAFKDRPPRRIRQSGERPIQAVGRCSSITRMFHNRYVMQWCNRSQLPYGSSCRIEAATQDESATSSECLLSRRHFDAVIGGFWPIGDLTSTETLEFGTSHVEYPHVALRGPTYHENSHANHTWHPPSHQTACFKGSEAPPVWVRFPSPAPFFVVWRLPALS
jgi:hypothetical protein